MDYRMNLVAELRSAKEFQSGHDFGLSGIVPNEEVNTSSPVYAAGVVSGQKERIRRQKEEDKKQRSEE